MFGQKTNSPQRHKPCHARLEHWYALFHRLLSFFFLFFSHSLRHYDNVCTSTHQTCKALILEQCPQAYNGYTHTHTHTRQHTTQCHYHPSTHQHTHIPPHYHHHTNTTAIVGGGVCIQYTHHTLWSEIPHLFQHQKEGKDCGDRFRSKKPSHHTTNWTERTHMLSYSLPPSLPLWHHQTP